MHVDHAAFGVEVANLQVESFFDAESQRVEGPQEHGMMLLPHGTDNLVHLLLREHRGQRFLLRQPELLEHIPITGHGLGIEELELDIEKSPG